jgi:hypothetical protein
MYSTRIGRLTKSFGNGNGRRVKAASCGGLWGIKHHRFRIMAEPKPESKIVILSGSSSKKLGFSCIRRRKFRKITGT